MTTPRGAGDIAALAATGAAVGLVALAAATVHDLRRPRAAAEPLAPPPVGPGQIDLSIVIPTKDGGAALRPAVEAVLATLERRRAGASEVIVVVDGSTDGSDATLVGLPVRVLRLDRNQGKGAALRHGFAAAEGRLVGFIDGDGDLDPSVLLTMEAALVADPAVWAAVGDRHHDASRVIQRPARRLLSAAHRWLVHLLFGLHARDTQCGVKVFRRGALAVALASSRERGFALDLELLAVASRSALGDVVPVPVRLHRPADAPSTVGVRAVLGLAAATARVRLRLATGAGRAADGAAAWTGPTGVLPSGPVAVGR